MYQLNECISYSIAVFIVVLVSGLIINLLEKHYIFQILGSTFFFMYTILKPIPIIKNNINIDFKDIYLASLPMLMGILACLISMLAGFLIFPSIRNKFKD